VRWLQRQAWVNYDEQGRPLRVNDSARDITARKEVEEALRQSETYLRSLIDSQTAFNIRVDMDGNISYYNNRYAAQFEWIAPSLLGLSALVMILPADHDKVRAAVMRCMVQVSTPVQVEMRKPTRNGDYIWTFWEFIAIQDEQGAVTEIQCVGFDITQQKQVEAALRASEQRYRQMFEMHGLPKLIIDPATGSIVDANLAAGRYYGYDPAHLRTLSIFAFTTGGGESKDGESN
jgi:PAS domain S-box-containing protein